MRVFVTDSGGPELIVRLLNVGQGDATYIRNGSSRVLIDGGPDPAILGRFLDSLRLNGSTIDVVILSHQHLDHYSGLTELFRTSRHIRIRYFFENKDPTPAVTLAILRDSILARVDRDSLIYRDTDDPCSDGRAVCTITMTGGAKLHKQLPEGLCRLRGGCGRGVERGRGSHVGHDNANLGWRRKVIQAALQCVY